MTERSLRNDKWTQSAIGFVSIGSEDLSKH